MASYHIRAKRIFNPVITFASVGSFFLGKIQVLFTRLYNYVSYARIGQKKRSGFALSEEWQQSSISRFFIGSSQCSINFAGKLQYDLCRRNKHAVQLAPRLREPSAGFYVSHANCIIFLSIKERIELQ